MDIDKRYIDFKHLFGTTCSAQDTSSGQTVIIKKLTRIFDAREDAKKAYREIKILKFVSHDNLTKLIDLYPNSDRPDKFCDVLVF